MVNDGQCRVIALQSEYLKMKQKRKLLTRVLTASNDAQGVVRALRSIVSLIDVFTVRSRIPCVEEPRCLSGIQMENTLQSAIGVEKMREVCCYRATWVSMNELLTAWKDAKLKDLRHVAAAKWKAQDQKGCMEGTRIKILADLLAWAMEADAPPIYWLCGRAGTGKSSIAYTFSSWLSANRVLGGSFFCSRRGSPEQRDDRRILPTLARAMADISPRFKSALLDALDQDSDVGDYASSEQFTPLMAEPFKQAFREEPPVHVLVIDALDECENEEATERLLETILKNAQSSRIKFFITGRPMPRIQDAFSDAVEKRVLLLHAVKRDDVDEDIRKYLFDRLGRAAKRRRLTTEGWPPEDLVGKLVERAEGLFIVASTVCRYIEGDGELEGQLKEIISRPIVGLDELYRQVLKNALDKFQYRQDTDECLLIIGVIILLRDQFSPNDLGELLGLRPDNVRGRLRSLQSVLDVPEEPDVVIRTMHASFHDFLIDRQRSGPKTDSCFSGDFFIDPAIYHQRIVFYCLEFITNYEGDKSGSTFVYASLNWLYHLDCVLVNKGEKNLFDSQAELVVCIRNLVNKAFDSWMKTLFRSRGAQETFECLDSVVRKLKVSPMHAFYQNALFLPRCASRNCLTFGRVFEY